MLHGMMRMAQQKTSQTLGENAGEQMKGQLQVGCSPPLPDCSNIHVYVCIHTDTEYASRQGGVYTHTQRYVPNQTAKEVGPR